MARRRHGRRSYRRANPLSDTQKWVLIGVGGAVVAGIVYALYQSGQAVQAVGSSIASQIANPPAPPAFPPATQPTAPSNVDVITPTGTNVVPLQAQSVTGPVGTPTPVAGGNQVAWNPGF